MRFLILDEAGQLKGAAWPAGCSDTLDRISQRLFSGAGQHVMMWRRRVDRRGQERAELQCWNYSCYCDGSVFRKLSGSLSFSTTVADDLEFTPLLGFQKCLDPLSLTQMLCT